MRDVQWMKWSRHHANRRRRRAVQRSAGSARRGIVSGGPYGFQQWGTAVGAARGGEFAMSETTTYLELSQEAGSAHKFYEVSVSGTAVSVRYGRIGTPGQQQTSTFPTREKAQAAAAR